MATASLPPPMPTTIFQSHYEIDTPRLRLRSAVPDDAEAVYKLLASPENNPHSRVDPSESAAVYRERIAGWADASAKGESAFMVVADRATGELVGFGGFNSLVHRVVRVRPHSGQQEKEKEKEKSAADAADVVLVGDAGILIDRRHWRRGYAREALCATVEFGFAVFGVGAMFLETDDANEGMRALMGALGLAHVGLKKRPAAAPDPDATAEPNSNRASQSGRQWWEYCFDLVDWEAAKAAMRASGTWPL